MFFLVLIDILIFHLDPSSLNTLICHSKFFIHALQRCLSDSSSVFMPLFAGLRQPICLQTIDGFAHILRVCTNAGEAQTTWLDSNVTGRISQDALEVPFESP